MQDTWMVQVPIKELLALCGLKDEMEKISTENNQLRREIEGLRNIQSQMMELLREFSRKEKRAA